MEKRCIKLDSNENQFTHDIDFSKCVSDIDPKMYPDVTIHKLRSSLSDFYKIPIDEIFCSNGSDFLIKALTFGLISYKDEVLIPDIAFPTYEIAAKIKECSYKLIPLKNHFIDLDETLNSISEKTKLIWISNPHNPTGTLLTETDIEEFLKKVPSHIYVVLDEAYIEYLPKGTIDSFKLYKEFSNVIILRTFSKAYGLAGARIGYGIARVDIINKFRDMLGPFDVNSYAQAVAEKVIFEQKYLDRVRAENLSGMSQIEKMCSELNLKYIKSYTSFIMFYVGEDAIDISEYLKDNGILIKEGSLIGMPGWLRLTIGTSEQNCFVEEKIRGYFKERH